MVNLVSNSTEAGIHFCIDAAKKKRSIFSFEICSSIGNLSTVHCYFINSVFKLKQFLYLISNYWYYCFLCAVLALHDNLLK